MSTENKYFINDITKSVFEKDIEITATSPKNALIKAGYKAERDYTGKGELLVYAQYNGKYKSYVYRKKY